VAQREQRIARLLFATRKRQADKIQRLQLLQFQPPGPIGSIQRRLLGWPRYRRHAELSPPDDKEEEEGNDEEKEKGQDLEEVYIQWRMQRLKPLAGAHISVALGPRRAERMSQRALAHLLRPSYDLPRSSPAPENPLGMSSHSASMEDPSPSRKLFPNPGRLQLQPLPPARSRADWTRLRAALLRRTRLSREPCVVPDRLLKRLEVGPGGALSSAFSHSGHLLALACPAVAASSSSYHLRLVDPDLQVEVALALHAHKGQVYQLSWSLNDRFLLSCSGDGLVKVWDLLALVAHGPVHAARYGQGSGLGLGGAQNSPRSSPGPKNPSRRDSKIALISSGLTLAPQLLLSCAHNPPVFVYSVTL